MLARIASFELRYQLKSPVFWVSGVLFFLFAFATMALPDNFQIGGRGNTHANSPFAIAITCLVFSIFFTFVSTAFVANVVIRDDETGFGPIVRATPVSKFAYLYGRFAGAFIAAALAFLLIPLALAIGSALPWLDPQTLGPFRLGAYAYVYVVLVLPGLFFSAAILFVLATVTRSMMASYVGLVAILVLYFTSRAVLSLLEYRTTAAVLDPFGLGAFDEAVRYWTAADRNTLLPPLTGPLLENRLLWTALGAAALALAYPLFRVEQRGRKARRGERAAAKAEIAPPSAVGVRPASLVLACPGRPSFDRTTALAQAWARTRLDMAQVFKSPAFFVLLALGLLLSGSQLWFQPTPFGGAAYPTTRAMIGVLRQTFSIIPLIVAVYYAGELVWRERDRRTEEIIDATPIPDWVYVAPKIAAVSLVLIALQASAALLAIVVQASKGYTAFELGKYLGWWIVPEGVDVILIAVLAVFLQAIAPHKYVGWGLMLLVLVAQLTLNGMGLEDNLYQYGSGPDVPLSDINGLGIFGIARWSFRAYWSAVALLLAVLAYGLWRRGADVRLRPRLVRLPRKLRGGAGALAAAALALSFGLGAWCYVNTHVWNPYRTGKDNERWLADYEKTLYRYAAIRPPVLTDLQMTVDLYPRERRVAAHGLYVFQNQTGQPMRELHVRFARDVRVRGLSVEGARPARTFEAFNYRIFAFDTPLAPGAQARLSWSTERGDRGFRNSYPELASTDAAIVVGNGSFLDDGQIGPTLGMDRSSLLRDRSKRRRYGLPGDIRPPRLEDAAWATQVNGLGPSNGFANTDITVSTDADQLPVAPGYKVADTTSGGRRTIRYRSDAPMLSLISVQSERYAVAQARVGDVDLAVLHHPPHAWNVRRMLDVARAGLTLYPQVFDPYQFRQFRILEFPGYATFAESFPNTIPFSEDVGFTADLRDRSKTDLAAYVTAHELAHQWWAHQEAPADMQGAAMVTESLAQYSALLLMERLYGPDQIRRFLKYELDRYLRGRGADPVQELPLERVEDQPYIHYQKGSLVMWRLRQEIGEAAVNRALQRFLAAHHLRGAPYATSKALVDLFRQEAGPDPRRQQLITDLFEKITLYDLKAKAAQARRRADGRWDVTLTLSAAKLYADGGGGEHPAPMDETVQVGLFSREPGKPGFKAGDVIWLRPMTVKTGTTQVTLTVARKPAFAGIDPYNVLIDRNSEDNLTKVAG